MSIYQLKMLNFWREKKNWTIICIYLLMMVFFYIYNDNKLIQEYELLTQEMEEKLYIGDIHADLSTIEEQYSGDPVQTLAQFRLRNNYIQGWTNHKTKEFQSIETVTTANYFNFLTGLPPEISDTLDEDEFPPSDYAENRVKQIEQLNSMNLTLQSSRYGKDGCSFLTAILYFLTSFLGIFLFLFLFGDFISSDYEKQTIRLVFTSITSKRAYLSKSIIITMMHACLFFCGIALLSFVIATSLGGVGQINYPLISPTQKSLFFPTYSYWLQVSLLFFCVLLFSYLCYTVFVLFIKQSLLSVIGTCLFLFIMNQLSLFPPFHKLASFSPFTYLNASNVFIGKNFDLAFFSTEGQGNVEYEMIVENRAYYLGNNLATQLKNPFITFQTGIIVLLISSVLLFICLNILTKRKRII